MALIQSLVKSAPDIIRESAQSPLGIIALIIFVLSIIGLIFFRNEKPAIKVAIFVLMLVSFIGFGIVVYRASSTQAFIPSVSPSSNPQVVRPASVASTSSPTSIITHPEIQVWVNTKSGKFFCPGSKWYGTTTKGKEMTQKAAQEEGYKPAYGKVCK